MSWQAYVDEQLLATGKVSKAAIVGLRGGVWASSAGFTVSKDEEKAAIAAFNDPTVTQTNGIRLASSKYFTLEATTAHVYGKKAADGCVLVKTNQAVIVAVYIAPIQQAECVTVVEKLGDYLKSVNY